MNNIAIKSWVFNPELQGKFVRVYGSDHEGDSVDREGLVLNVNGENLKLSSDGTERSFYLGEFGQNGLKLEVWDQFTKYEMPQEADQTLVD